MEKNYEGVSRREFLALGAAFAGLSLSALAGRSALAADAASSSHDGEVKGAASSAKDAAAASSKKDAAAAATTNPSIKAAVSTELPMVVDRKNKVVFIAVQVTDTTFAGPSGVLSAFESSSDGTTCLLRAINTDLETYEGLTAVGFKQGDKLAITLQWNKGDEMPLEQCLTGGYTPNLVFSGNRDDGKEDPTGDIVALDGRKTALITDASIAEGAEAKFAGNPDVLPKKGTNVTMAIRLA